MGDAIGEETRSRKIHSSATAASGRGHGRHVPCENFPRVAKLEAAVVAKPADKQPAIAALPVRINLFGNLRRRSHSPALIRAGFRRPLRRHGDR